MSDGLMRGRIAGCSSSAVAGTLAAFLVAALLVATPTPAGAQHGDGWRFVGGVAYEQAGLGSTLVERLDELGFGSTIDGVEHPFNSNAGLNAVLMLGLGYHTGAPTFIEVLVSNGPRGHAQGYSISRRMRLLVTYSSLVVAPVVGAHLGRFRLKAGPVMNAGRWEGRRNAVLTGQGSTVSWGWMAGASIDQLYGATLFSLTAGFRSFPAVDLREAIRLELQGGYRSFFIGLTVMPR